MSLKHGRNNQFVPRRPCDRPPATRHRQGIRFSLLEDETGIANIIIAPDVFEQNRLVVTRSRFLLIQGKLQIQEGVVHVKALRIEPLILSEDLSG